MEDLVPWLSFPIVTFLKRSRPLKGPVLSDSLLTLRCRLRIQKEYCMCGMCPQWSTRRSTFPWQCYAVLRLPHCFPALPVGGILCGLTDWCVSLIRLFFHRRRVQPQDGKTSGQQKPTKWTSSGSGFSWTKPRQMFVSLALLAFALITSLFTISERHFQDYASLYHP